jgi:hypothetical protein
MKRQTPIGSIVTSGALRTCTVLKGLVIAIGMSRGADQVVDPNLPRSRLTVPLRHSREAAGGTGSSLPPPAAPPAPSGLSVVLAASPHG